MYQRRITFFTEKHFFFGFGRATGNIRDSAMLAPSEYGEFK